MTEQLSTRSPAAVPPCRHERLRRYVFHCDGVEYVALECEDCPKSTSLPIGAEDLWPLEWWTRARVFYADLADKG